VGGRIIGIDLGTANSCVAVVRGDRPEILRDGGMSTIPSCLAFQRGKEVVGGPAKRQSVTDPHGTVAAVKRLMGYSYESPEIQSARERVTYAMRPSPLGGVLIEVGGKELTPVQISARILQKVRQVAEDALGETIEKAVISVPAHFNDMQRRATKLAAEYAGLEAVRLINEPTAAAFAYGYRRGEDFTLAVYDLGGGTFDITVMTAQGDTFEVEATDGDAYLGGEDMDFCIVQWLADEYKAEHGIDLLEDDSARNRLKEAAELAKIDLSERDAAQIDLPFLGQLPNGTRPNFARSLTKQKLDELSRPLIERTLAICRRCLEEAGLTTEDVDETLLVGGQTRMPMVRQAVTEFFGREPRRDINPDEVVALGAALYGYSLVADEMQEQAEGAAEEAYAVALKETEIARKVVSGVKQLKESPDRGLPLANRLEELLKEAEAELPTPVARERGDDDTDLPIAVESLQAELAKLEEEADQAVESVLSQLPPPEEGGGPLLEDAAEEFGGAADLGGAEPSEFSASELGGAAEQAAASESAAAHAEAMEMAKELINERLSSAREASEQASAHIDEAEQLGQARRVNLIDVTSHPLGIAAAGDVFSVLIPKNTPVPAEEERIFTTNQDDQTEVEVRVSQGGAKRASDNQFLGAFILEGIPPARRMEPRICVTFHIDEDGILAVRARDDASQAEQGIRVEDPLGLRPTDPNESGKGSSLSDLPSDLEL
jgi:molecular chaperone DnaK (HSP70)